jgi:RNA polymerase sigma-70 factor (ECF subfamily)
LTRQIIQRIALDELQQLINDCAANNRLSQEKLYKQFYPALFLLCKRFFADNHQALEALNDGMLKVYKQIAQYDSTKGNFFNWMYTIIRNTALDKLKSKHFFTVQIGENNTTHIAQEDNPLQLLEQKDVHQLLNVLPPATRVICILFYLDGFCIKDICHQLQVSSGTVKWHLSETRRKLKPFLKAYYSN